MGLSSTTSSPTSNSAGSNKVESNVPCVAVGNEGTTEPGTTLPRICWHLRDAAKHFMLDAKHVGVDAATFTQNCESATAKLSSRVVRTDPIGQNRELFMPVFADTTLAPAQITLRFTDSWPAIEHHRALRQQLIADGLLVESTRALLDLREAITPPHYAARRIIEAIIADGPIPAIRAYLVASAAQFGFASQLVTVSPSSWRSGIFTSEQQARSWLEAKATFSEGAR
jgi:hypothetical protein